MTENLFYPLALAVRLVARPRASSGRRWRRARGARRRARRGVRDPVAGARASCRASRPRRSLLALIAGEPRDALRPFAAAATSSAAVAALVLVVGAQAARGQLARRPPRRVQRRRRRRLRRRHALRFWLWHVEELDLYVGDRPVRRARHPAARAARTLPEPAAGAPRRDPRARRRGRRSSSATFASRFAPDRVQDRYLFSLAPLLVVCAARLDRARRAAPADRVRDRRLAAVALVARRSRTCASSASRRSPTRSA